MEHSTAAIFYRVDGTNFAFGLEWITAAANKTAVTQAKAAARKKKATHIAWRRKKAQAGLARVSDGPGASLFNPWRSAASAFADLPYSSLLAAFVFRDGKTWIFAAESGRIYTKGDIVFDDQEKARKYFDELYAQRYWNDIFAPAGWHQRAKQIDPLAVLRRKIPDGTVSRVFDGVASTLGLVSRPGEYLVAAEFDVKSVAKSKLMMAGTVVAIAAIGVTGYARWKAAHAHTKIAAPPPAYFPTIIPAKAMLDACMTQLPEAVYRAQTPGWSVVDNICGAGQIIITLASDPGTPKSTMVAYHSEAQLADGGKVVLSTPLRAPLEQAVVIDPLISEMQYRNLFVVMDEQSNATNKVDPAVGPGGDAPKFDGRPRPRPYLVSEWTFETTSAPLMWGPDLVAIPNLEIVTVQMRMTEHGLAWSLKGNAYVQR